MISYFERVITFADAATADKTSTTLVSPDGIWQLTSVSWNPDSDGAVTADGTDYRTMLVKNGSTTLCTITTNSGAPPAGTSWVAGTPVAGSLSASGGAKFEFTGGTDSVIVSSTHTGSTGKVAKGQMILGFTKKQPKTYPS